MPFLAVVHGVGFWGFVDVEGIFLARFLLSLLLQRDQFGVGGAILPEVDDVVGGDDYVRLVHFAVFGFDGDGFGLDGAPDGVAEDEEPLVDGFVGGVFGDEYTILPTSNNLLQPVHVLNMPRINRSVPEHDAHVVPLGLSEREDQSFREVAPHVLRLDVGE